MTTQNSGRAVSNRNLKPFKKGQSGNAGGRPKEERAVVEALRLSGLALAQKLIALGMKGNVRAIEVALNRAYGKPKEHVEFSDPDAKREAWNFDRLTLDEKRELSRLAMKATGKTTHAGGIVRELSTAELAAAEHPAEDYPTKVRSQTPQGSLPAGEETH